MENELHWTTVQRKIDDLVPQVINPRKISSKQMSDLKKSLQAFNLVEIPAIDTNGNILSGHQRLKAMQVLGRGQEIIDVRIPSRALSEEESRKYLIASNSIHADWNFDLLKSFEIPLLVDVGFEPIELSTMFNQNEQVAEDHFQEIGRAHV